MPLPKDYRARKGDVVALHATVGYDHSPMDESLTVTILGRHAFLEIGIEAVVDLYSIGLNPGDRVVMPDSTQREVWTVVALNDDTAWIHLPSDGRGDRLVPRSLLTRAPEPATEPCCLEARNIPIAVS